jgi:phytoene synthase
MSFAAPSRDEPAAGSSFFAAFRVLPVERRAALNAVYGFCREVDDAVDDAASAPAAREALERLASRLDRIYGSGTTDPAERSLARAVGRYELPRQPFDDLIEGVSWDLDRRRYADTPDLRRYCYHVASTVGLLCVRIFGCSGESCDAYAEELGIALQWTNILRDVGSDLSRGRVYLTERSLRRHDLSETALHRADPVSRRRLTALIREEAAYARSRYAAAERMLPDEERPKVLAGEIMGGIYRQLLDRVERAGHEVLDRKVRVPTPRRAWIAAGLLLRRKVLRSRRAPA